MKTLKSQKFQSKEAKSAMVSGKRQQFNTEVINVRNKYIQKKSMPDCNMTLKLHPMASISYIKNYL